MSEIERKFRLKQPPPRGLIGAGIRVQQVYLLSTPGELRIRRYGDAYYMTVKTDGSLVRREWETEIPDWIFKQFWETADQRIEKTRYPIALDQWRLEFDEYDGSLK